MRTHFRDSQAWVAENLKLSAASNESCKLYDAALTQYVGWYDDANFGGLDGTLEKLYASDPTFVMGQVLINGLELMSTSKSAYFDKGLRDNIESIVAEAEKSSLTSREKLHVAALKHLADGFWAEAAEIWDEILIDHPTDMLAIKFGHDTYFYLGYHQQIRDGIARILPAWKTSTPLYSYLYGMLAFGLEENNLYDRAMETAKKGLEMNKNDGWSTHAVAHIYEMTGQHDNGIDFLVSTMDDWTFCNSLACHVFWHLGLSHIERGDLAAAVDVYDNEIGRRSASGSMLDIVDMTSFLYRLKIEGVNVGERWQQAIELCQPHVEDHATVFNDAHFLMAYLGAKDKPLTEKLFESANKFLSVGQGDNHGITKEIGMPLLNALVAFDDARYDEAFELFYPLRYKLYRIGGSHAQRDLFHQLIIISALKSTDLRHQKLAEMLLAERKALKENSPLTDRLIAQAVASHHQA